jgi:hypothetical protein
MTRPTVPVTIVCPKCHGSKYELMPCPMSVQRLAPIESFPCTPAFGGCGGSGTVSAQLPAVEVDRLVRERVEAMTNEATMILAGRVFDAYDETEVGNVRPILLAALGCTEEGA